MWAPEARNPEAGGDLSLAGAGCLAPCSPQAMSGCGLCIRTQTQLLLYDTLRGHSFTACDGRGPPWPKDACPPLSGLGGPGWVEEKWVSSVAMVTAAAPCQPPRLLATNLTMRSFVQPVGMGARRVRLGARVCMKCVCVCVCAGSHKCLLRASMHAWPREPTDPGRTLPTSLPTEGMRFILPL